MHASLCVCRGGVDFSVGKEQGGAVSLVAHSESVERNTPSGCIVSFQLHRWSYVENMVSCPFIYWNLTMSPEIGRYVLSFPVQIV